ncbi:MAG: site-specific integrase [Bacteroidota bacterium]
MDNHFGYTFFIRSIRSKPEFGAIYLRISSNGKRAACSLHRKVLKRDWDTDLYQVVTDAPESLVLNNYLTKVKADILKIHQRFLFSDKPFSAQDIIDSYLGKDKLKKAENQKMVLQIFQEHNDKVDRLVGKDFAAGTAERYRTAKKHLTVYIKKEYRRDDLPVKEVDFKFISGFEYYLKTERKCAHNSAVKYVVNFKKIIRIAYSNRWIKRDPFLNWKGKLKTVDREFLNQEEIQSIINKNLKNERLSLVKDIFIFACYTGLAYADVKKLTKDHLVKGIDGGMWIKSNRTKTKSKTNIPLLPTAELILEKYSNDDTEFLLPILTNQKMNAYLKEIADLCSINKNLTFHLARHTFATTVTLSNGVPIESVSKMLGHKNLRATQHYAKILDRKVSDDMAVLKSKLFG